MFDFSRRVSPFMAVITGSLMLAACGGPHAELPAAPLGQTAVEAPTYVIGPLDSVSVFVWRAPELSTTAVVRPDGRVTLPLVEELTAAGKTPSELGRDIEQELAKFVRDPIVSVSVGGFVSTFDRQIRIVGEATAPQAIPYRADMTMLDVMIQVGGLTDFAAGNRTILARVEDGKQQEYRVRVDDLIRDGDTSANVLVQPGDVIIVPESIF